MRISFQKNLEGYTLDLTAKRRGEAWGEEGRRGKHTRKVVSFFASSIVVSL
jgi:hypothetical protein